MFVLMPIFFRCFFKIALLLYVPSAMLLISRRKIISSISILNTISFMRLVFLMTRLVWSFLMLPLSLLLIANLSSGNPLNSVKGRVAACAALDGFP